MTLTVQADLLQGTDAWFEARRGIVTASVVGQLITVSALGAIDYECPTCQAAATFPCVSVAKGKPSEPIKTTHPARTQVAVDQADQSPPVFTVADTDTARKVTASITAERISGNTDQTFINADMWRGIDDEPRAREVYAETYAPVREVGFMVEDKWGFEIGYSPDGVVGDDGLIEVKSRRQSNHLLDVVDGDVPAVNMAQLQCGLLVSGRAWIDYLSYCGGMHLWRKRVFPDAAWFDAILTAVAHFESTSADLVASYTEATTGLAMTQRPADLEMVI